ncbi:uncharacterized protein [Venturia canescens]|uniref:uncharacterized protein n=1 Tax=Venturia canescens TaxID=32260 RepID=UPI001C9C69A1|nr:uncharacterized protein LOC122407407 [Venturia canescens]XP_043269524.1 uncharacterized protein LOC122407407 [Venturia canescens]
MAYYLWQNQVSSYADPCEETENFGDDSSESEEDILSEESHNSDYETSTNSEIDDDEQENATHNRRILQPRARGRPTTILKGRNGFKWHTRSGSRHSDRNSAAELITPAPQHEASNVQKIEELWKLLFNDEMLKIIVDCTNEKIEEVCLTMIRDNKRPRTCYRHYTNVAEISAFIGLLYYSGRWKSNNVPTAHLWDKINGTTFYRCVMSRPRFTFIAQCLRFDVKASREPNDRLAPIRKLWDLFIGNCSRYYKPSKYCTVGKQFLSFQGKCPFRMFIKSKPDKCGIKIITLNDARTSYLIHGVPYLGKIGNSPTKTAEDFFAEVTKPIHGTRRSVTCDDSFTSIPLLINMLKAPYSMEITGTIRKNKREIPAEFLLVDKKPPSTKFAFTSDLTLLSFSPKKYKVVVLASSHLRTTNITGRKSDIVHHYNITKVGTDTFDQLCNSYTTARVTRRWPLRFFFGMLDQAIVNARILHKCSAINRGEDHEIMSPSKCLDEIIQYLVRPYLQERLETLSLRLNIKFAIGGILRREHQMAASEGIRHLDKKIRCRLCPRSRDRKTRQMCPSCHRPMCDEHRILLCLECGGMK